ncbi:hypothetical protein [Brevundimonas naejangsanensis]
MTHELSKYAEALLRAEEHVTEIARRRPTEISVSVIGTWSKGPYKALVIRGGLLWRSEEIGRLAISAYRSNDRAAAVLLTRALMENTGLHWRLSALLGERANLTPDELDDTLTNMLMGWKGDDEFPQALNVLGLIDRIDREVPGIRHAYNSLSEIAHPNYGGVHGLYARIDHDRFVTSFGRDLRGKEATHAGASALAASLGLQLVADKRVSDLLPVWISELPSLDEPREPD